jgi:hypothetical protein
MQVCTTSGCADDLPNALWIAILQLVPQQQRLSCCALVSSAWKAAAAQATTLVVQQLSLKAAPALNSWLALYDNQLHSLKLSSCRDTQPVLTLPLGELKHLQQLQVEGCKLVQLPNQGVQLPYRRGPAAQPVLSKLRHLQLSSVQLLEVTSLLRLTQQAPNLSTPG